MRRFVAFLVLSISVLLGVAFNFGNVLRNTNAGVDYDAGREFVFRVSDIEDEETILRENDINKIKDIVEKRLNDAEVNRYKILTEGNDQIRVVVGETTTTQYEYIKELISFNATFELATTDDQEYATANQIFNNSTARVAFKNSKDDNILPYVVIKISDKNRVKTLAEAALAITPSSTEEESTATADENMLILWAGKSEGETYEFANSGEEGSDKVLEKVFMKFDPNNLYFDNDTQEEIAVRISANDTNGNSVIDNSEVRAAVALAKHYTNLFNAGSLDYNVEFLFEAPTSALVENFINYGTIATLAGSATTIAFVIALVLIAIFICVFYRLGGVASIVTSITTLLFTFMIFNSVGLEFNIAAVVGLLIVTLVSTVSSLIFHEKIKDESYKGRNLKKANLEAVKKTRLTIIDIHVVLLIISGITYFIGHGMLESLAMVGVIGSIISYLLNITLYRLLMWLLTNNTSFQSKPEVLGIRRENVPNLLKDEKQSYYGPNAERDFTKNAKKKNIIITAITGVVALAMILIGSINGNVVARSRDDSLTRVYYEIHQYSDKEEIFSVDYLSSEFENANIRVSNIEVYEGTDDNDETIHYYVIDLKDEMTGDSVLESDMTFETYLDTLISHSESRDTWSIRQVVSYGDQPSINNILLGLSVGLIVASIYVAIRYNVANALSTLVVSSVSSLLSVGFMSVTRIPVIAPTFVSLYFIVIASVLMAIVLAQKNKEMQKDNKENLTAEVVSGRALSIASAPMLIIALISGYIAIDYLGFGPGTYNSLFGCAIIGVGVAILLMLFTYIPLYNALSKVFKPLHLHRKTREKNGNIGNIKSNKSSEPEEKIYIGIND